MITGDNGINLIKRYEGYCDRPYRDIVGLWTVGYGHLICRTDALPDSWNRVFTIDELTRILKDDLKRFERGVTMLCPVQLTQNQFDALVSFSFNLGLGTLQRSTLRQKINRKDFQRVEKEFLKYIKAGGKIVTGLKNRRTDESALFLKA